MSQDTGDGGSGGGERRAGCENGGEIFFLSRSLRCGAVLPWLLPLTYCCCSAAAAAACGGSGGPPPPPSSHPSPLTPPLAGARPANPQQGHWKSVEPFWPGLVRPLANLMTNANPPTVKSSGHARTNQATHVSDRIPNRTGGLHGQPKATDDDLQPTWAVPRRRTGWRDGFGGRAAAPAAITSTRSRSMRRFSWWWSHTTRNAAEGNCERAHTHTKIHARPTTRCETEAARAVRPAAGGYSSLRPAAVKLPATRRLAPREAPSWQLPTGLCGTVIQYAPGSHQPVGPPTSGTWDFGVTRQDAHGHEEHAFPIESILRESTDGDGTGREEPTQQRTTQHRAASAVAKSCQAQGVATPPCHRHQRIPLYLDVRPKGARPPPLANVPKRQERRPVRKGKRAPHCRCAHERELCFLDDVRAIVQQAKTKKCPGKRDDDAHGSGTQLIVLRPPLLGASSVRSAQPWNPIPGTDRGGTLKVQGPQRSSVSREYRIGWLSCIHLAVGLGGGLLAVLGSWCHARRLHERGAQKRPFRCQVQAALQTDGGRPAGHRTVEWSTPQWRALPECEPALRAPEPPPPHTDARRRRLAALSFFSGIHGFCPATPTRGPLSRTPATLHLQPRRRLVSFTLKQPPNRHRSSSTLRSKPPLSKIRRANDHHNMTAQSRLAATPGPLTIGVLALQGGFIEHINLVRAAAERLAAAAASGAVIHAIEVRTPAELARCDGLIIPGGESTTISFVAAQSGLLEPLREFVKILKKPVWGTCAGLILLSEQANAAKKGGQELIGGLAVRVHRNHFGRQIESFEAGLTLPFLGEGAAPFPGVFIRAPVVEEVLQPAGGDGQKNNGVSVLATLPGRVDRMKAGVSQANPTDGSGDIIAVRQGNVLGTSFHPELTPDPRIHVWWLQEILRQRAEVPLR
ncbi:pyridoxine [Purpureocillium lilacinum]|uniref:glutaminase n=1 Tax=Purpureocillium lilacinum TaxID=33203 RepID=A0A2U3EAY6_PURLI|nr:pyridoxine [Purpureocillium lilacinum]